MTHKVSTIKLVLGMIVVAVLCLSARGVALAQGTWVDEIGNALTFYKASYPNSNWDPYIQEITLVRDALGRGDQRVIKKEMGTFFKMLRVRAHGISDVAADELYNFAVMVTPLQEYNISLPASAPGQ
jgi:hypothetical protein